MTVKIKQAYEKGIEDAFEKLGGFGDTLKKFMSGGSNPNRAAMNAGSKAKSGIRFDNNLTNSGKVNSSTSIPSQGPSFDATANASNVVR